MAEGDKKPTQDRRTFLKIGAGVVAGAAIASVVEIPYYSSVIGGNNNSSSTTVSSLQDELSTTKSQLSDTQNSLNATQSSLSQAQGTISNLNSQLTATQGSLSSANSQLGAANSQLSNVQSSLTAANSQNAAIAQQLTSTQGYLSSANAAISTLETQVNSASSQVTSLQGQVSTLSNLQAYLFLTPSEQPIVEALCETIIPNDSNGPGAVEANVQYFIDGMLAGDYGTNARNYRQGPFILPTSSPITVDGIAYSEGTIDNIACSPTSTDPFNGTNYQYAFERREFWRYGLAFIEEYSNTAYGGGFETLSATLQAQVVTDCFNNKPTNFTGPSPYEFITEVHQMVRAGFLMDPIYGGNAGMVGWILAGYPGVNQGDFFSEGFTMKELMVATSPTVLKPVSLAQLQALSGE